MILPFSQLEVARKNPGKFGERYAPRSGGFNSRNFRTFLSTAVREFHRGAAKQDVIDKFTKKCEDKLKLQLFFNPRLKHYVEILSDYCDSYRAQGCQFVEVKKTTKLTVGPHLLRGKIDRFDLRVAGGYRATMTQLNQSAWQGELRWPLMQKAIASELGAPTSEIEVGVFCYADGTYGYRTFTDQEISSAETEALSVMNEVEANIP
jgi:hypothetical protein